ncbi:MAG: TlpA disulfide reductase family protein [Pseudomonadota bacterium]
MLIDRHQLHVMLTVLTLFLLTGCDDKTQILTQGQVVPGFTLEQLESGSLRFPDDLQGKLVAIRFWADWCPFCKTEMQDIEPVYRKYRERDLVILAINVRQDPKTAARFIRKLDISYDVLLDRQGEVARRYGVIGLPTTFIVDPSGKLHTKILGESTPELFEKIIEDLL